MSLTPNFFALCIPPSPPQPQPHNPKPAGFANGFLFSGTKKAMPSATISIARHGSPDQSPFDALNRTVHFPNQINPPSFMTTYSISRDRNGNKTCRVTIPGKLGFAIQTLDNLPETHSNGICPETAGEVCAYVARFGTRRQRELIAS